MGPDWILKHAAKEERECVARPSSASAETAERTDLIG
jgi:hypothetical protein